MKYVTTRRKLLKLVNHSPFSFSWLHCPHNILDGRCSISLYTYVRMIWGKGSSQTIWTCGMSKKFPFAPLSRWYLEIVTAAKPSLPWLMQKHTCIHVLTHLTIYWTPSRCESYARSKWYNISKIKYGPWPPRHHSLFRKTNIYQRKVSFKFTIMANDLRNGAQWHEINSCNHVSRGEFTRECMTEQKAEGRKA